MKSMQRRGSSFRLGWLSPVPLVAVLILHCILLSSCVPPAAAVGKLVGTFPNLELGSLNVNVINPVNAVVGSQMFTSPNFVQLFANTPAWDANNKRFFIPVVANPNGEMKIAERWNEVNQQEADELKRMKKEAPTGWAKVRSDLAKLDKLKRALITDSNANGAADPEFNFSILGLQVTPDGKNVTLVSSWPFPLPYFYGLQYDPVTDSVLVLAMNENLTLDASQAADTAPSIPVILSSVNLKTGAVRNLTQLTSPLIPAIGGLGGAPTAIDVKQRQFIVSTWHMVEGQVMQSYVTLINIDTLTIVNRPQNKYIPSAMYFDTTKNVLHALLSPTASGALGNLTWGTVDSKSGAVTPIYTWQDNFHVFVIGSLAALDPVAGRFYSIIGDGFDTAVGLITVDVVTGQQLNVAQWNRQVLQPQSIVVLP